MVVGKNWNLGSLESWQVQHVKKEWCQVVIFFFFGYAVVVCRIYASGRDTDTYTRVWFLGFHGWPPRFSPLLFVLQMGKIWRYFSSLDWCLPEEHSPPAARDAPDMHTFQSVLGLAALPTVIQTPGFPYGLLRHSTFFSAYCISAAYPHLCFLGTS